MVRNRLVGIAAGFVVLLLSTGWTLRAQETQDTPAPETKTTTTKIKERTGEAVGSVKKGVRNAGEAIKNKITQAKEHVVAMEIETRVYARLHWDKLLTDAKIDLSAPRQGTIVLTGRVSTPQARVQALALTTGTVGVTEAIDHLTVAAPVSDEVK